MSARDSFALDALYKGIGARVLLVGFNELEADVFRCRLQMLSASTPILRVDSATLSGALLLLDVFRHHVVFIRLCERHTRGDCAAMDAFLAQLVKLRTVTVIPIAKERITVDYFRHHLCHVSPAYLGLPFQQEDILHILDSYGFSRSVIQSNKAPSVHF
jgi:predicted NodU family carbamoyl transferase